MRKPFHELSPEEFKALEDAGTTWSEVGRLHPQPDWCGYPDAVGPLGCWSLIGRMVSGEDYCKNCELYQPRAACADDGA